MENLGCLGPSPHGTDYSYDVTCCKTQPTCPEVRSPATQLTDAAVTGCANGGCTGRVRKPELKGKNLCNILVCATLFTGPRCGAIPVGMASAHQVDFDDDLFYEEAVLNLQIAEEGIEFARAVKAKKRAEELMKPSQRSSARLRR
eukprot:324468_1